MKRIVFVFTTVIFFALALSSCKKDETNNNGNNNGNTENPGGGGSNAVYVDLGLPSGTKWKSANEIGNGTGYYSFDEAVSTFGNSVPTKEQWQELKAYCTWEFQNNWSFKVVSANGNFIYLPAAGEQYENEGHTYNFGIGAVGSYWSSTFFDSDDAWSLYFNGEDQLWIQKYPRYIELSVRLVQK